METKPWYRSKTLWVNISVALTPLIAYIIANPAFAQAHLTPAHFVTYSFVIGMVNVGLRVITNSAVTLS